MLVTERGGPISLSENTEISADLCTSPNLNTGVVFKSQIERGDTSNQHVINTKYREAISNDGEVTTIDLRLTYDHSATISNDREAAFIRPVATSIYRVAVPNSSNRFSLVPAYQLPPADYLLLASFPLDIIKNRRIIVLPQNFHGKTKIWRFITPYERQKPQIP